MNKKKVLVLSDHALSTSGVGCQTRFLLNGLIEKGCWSFRQFGAAIKHNSYETVVVNEDFIIKPIDGFGNRDLIISTLLTEKPDLLFICTGSNKKNVMSLFSQQVNRVDPTLFSENPTPPFIGF